MTADDYLYTHYLAGCFAEFQLLDTLAPRAQHRIPRPWQAMYEPLYRRRRLRRVPAVNAVPDTSKLLALQSKATRFSGMTPTGRRKALRQIRKQLELQYLASTR